MQKKPNFISKEEIYAGHLSFYKCALVIPSLIPDKTAITLRREVVSSADSISVLLYAPQIDSFILCQQFRAGVFLNEADDDPFIFECVAGTMEPDMQPEALARKEIFEETGLTVDSLEKIAVIYKSPGIMTEKAYFYYAEVDGEIKSGFFGVDDEEIKTHLVKRVEAYKWLDDMKIRDASTAFALNWFRAKKDKSK
ncbi:NUDIX domain-containing protein [Legionella septentrionalis]|uniref:NUDIX domain-containing protein n=1 Tax=Legionella septentrionalis TaxID=2498109 RepID=UPI000F8E4243|nr:NUDIX hydrolase [Legionella septentrionalis]RUQ95080.1 NUDIX hydrolase [Legionella septentrionalis]